MNTSFLSVLTNLLVPCLLAAIAVYGLYKGVPVFDTFLEGAAEGMKISVKILPALIALLTCIGMFKASGGLDLITQALKPVAEFFGLPGEIVPLTLLRPLSGSGALVVYEDLLKSYGPDSLIGKIASVLQGSTETTFYTIALYFGATGIKKTRQTIPASLTADLTGFLVSALAVRLLLS